MASVEENVALLDHLRDLTAEGRQAERHALLWQRWRGLHHYLASFELENASREQLRPYVDDALPRFLHTLDLLPCAPDLRVLELGANPYLFTLLLRRLHRYDLHLGNYTSGSIYDATIAGGEQEVWSGAYGERYRFPFVSFNLECGDHPYEAHSFDIVLFCEILEHLVVDPLAVLPKLRRLLKPGGILLLTTPNAVRLVNLAHLLTGRNFFDRYHPANGVYGRHNREFTVAELTHLLSEAGFVVREAVTRYRYDYNQVAISSDDYAPQARVRYTRARLEEVLRAAGGSTEHRGDNIYVVAANPPADGR